MRHAFGHNYANSSFIVNVAMGQIPRFTEHCSSYLCIPCYLRNRPTSQAETSFWVYKYYILFRLL